MGIFRTYSYYKQLKNNFKLSPDEIQDLQVQKQFELARYAIRYIPYYRELAQELNFKFPEKAKDFHLESLPVLTRAIYQQKTDQFLTDHPQDKQKKIISTITSGSTGQPATIHREESSWDMLRAMKYRIFRYNGYQPWYRGVTWKLSKLPEKFHQKLGIAKERVLVRQSPLNEQIDFLNKWKPHVYYVNPSHLVNLIQFAKLNHQKIHRPRLIFTESEMLLPHWRKAISSYFDLDPLDIYGSREFGCFAFECQNRKGHHISSDLFKVEIVDEKGTPISDSRKEGRVVVTDFTDKCSPFIRYDTGDMGTLTKEPCSCGIPFPRLQSLDGRVCNWLTLPSGKTVSGEILLALHLREFTDILQYQGVYWKKNKTLVANLVVKNPSEFQQAKVVKSLEKALEGIKAEVYLVQGIPKEKSGKMKTFRIEEV